MKHNRPAPSRIARSTASSVWGPVQRQHQLAKGIYLFDTIGHGGDVAVIGVADLDHDMIEAARRAGLIETVAIQRTGRGTSIVGPSSHYTDLEGWAERNGYDLVEVWIGEEDCDYATILLASPAARQGFAKLMHDTEGWIVEHGTDESLLATIRRWTPQFFEALGNEVPHCHCGDYALPDDDVCFSHRLERKLGLKKETA